MKPVTIQAVHSLEERKEFLRFPWEVYQSDPHWVPPIFSERIQFTDPEHNPFFQHAEVDFFQAKRGDQTVGTIAAFTNFRHNEYHQENIGFFGFFEVLQDPEAAQALLTTAEDWARERGHNALRGPAQFDTNEECGLLVDGFDDSPRILMTYNPPYYQQYLEDCGYQKEIDLWAYKLGTQDFIAKIGERLNRLTNKILARRNIVVRKLDMKIFDAEVEKVKGPLQRGLVQELGFCSHGRCRIRSPGGRTPPNNRSGSGVHRRKRRTTGRLQPLLAGPQPAAPPGVPQAPHAGVVVDGQAGLALESPQPGGLGPGVCPWGDLRIPQPGHRRRVLLPDRPGGDKERVSSSEK